MVRDRDSPANGTGTGSSRRCPSVGIHDKFQLNNHAHPHSRAGTHRHTRSEWLDRVENVIKVNKSVIYRASGTFREAIVHSWSTVGDFASRLHFGSADYRVDFGAFTVSDLHLKRILVRVAEVLRANIVVTSGDRDIVPPGGSKKSLHLRKQAADFHMRPLSDSTVFSRLQNHAGSIFDPTEAYELIQHGTRTATTGPHIHLGHWPRSEKPPGIYCKIEGMSAEDKECRLIRTIRVHEFR